MMAPTADDTVAWFGPSTSRKFSANANEGIDTRSGARSAIGSASNEPSDFRLRPWTSPPGHRISTSGSYMTSSRGLAAIE